jgi:adenine-specific DNA-methyltransferase
MRIRSQAALRTATKRKALGVYYTPGLLVDHVLDHTLGRLLEGKTPQQAAKLRILDPACGAGAFLLGAYRQLLAWHEKIGPQDSRQFTPVEKVNLLCNNLYGVDLDRRAVEKAKRSLLRMAREADPDCRRTLPNLANNIQCGDALLGPDFPGGEYCHSLFAWDAAFPAIHQAGGFDVVLGNPPWGQKGIVVDTAVKQYVWTHYPSSRGIFDLFRPFVEQGVRLLKPGGFFGMVLPDTLLLKNYAQTRRFLLEQLTLDTLDWWGLAFEGVVLDAVTLTGRKQSSPPVHCVRTTVHKSPALLVQEVPQTDFAANPRFVFNLSLSPADRRLLQELENRPKLGDYFEVHEGVHSGNIRDELFVSRRLDASCRKLLLGRGEIRPYGLSWQGRYIRLSALPQARTRQRYANLGKPHWHERPKLLVRRTGDHVLAALDREGRYASNNFFLLFPKQPCSLDLDGLCALLNSRLMTWFFRAIEPRQGRAFVELKIKHLTIFPLPDGVCQSGGCERLNELGKQRAKLASTSEQDKVAVVQRAITLVEAEIEGVVSEGFPQFEDGGWPSLV